MADCILNLRDLVAAEVLKDPTGGPLNKVINFLMSQTMGKFSTNSFINRRPDETHNLGEELRYSEADWS